MARVAASLWKSLFVIKLVLLLSDGVQSIQQLHYQLVENTGNGYSVGNIQSSVTGNDYKFSNGSNCTKYFNLLSTGEIQTKVNIDREHFIEVMDTDSITCVVEYKDSVSGVKKSLIVIIDIQDVNDNKPAFFGLQHPVDNRTVFENLKTGSIILLLMPYDLDKGLNGTINFTIIEGNEQNVFSLRPPAIGDSSSDRVLYLNVELDYEQTPVFNLTFKLTDNGVNPLVSYQSLLIYLIDVNDQAPSFPISDFYFEVFEDHPVGKEHPIGRVNATDQDSATHALIYYWLTDSSDHSDLFGVNTTTGEIYLLKPLDFDSATTVEYQFTVEARNPETISGTFAAVRVEVFDVNDEKPQLQSSASISVVEGQPNYTFYIRYEDLDKLAPNNEISNFSLSFSTELQYHIIGTAKHTLGNYILYFLTFVIDEPVDRELTPVINLTVLATDNGNIPLTSETIITITVKDINDNAPHFTQEKFYGKVAESSVPVRHVLTLTAIDPDSETNAVFEYAITEIRPSLAKDWFQINAINGEVSLIGQPSYSSLDEGNVEISVIATDNDGNSNTSVAVISILPSVTFEPNSFQEYSTTNLIGASKIYMEFRTDGDDSLFLYQRSLDQPSLEAYLQLTDGKITYSNGTRRIERLFDLTPNIWYSLLIDMDDSNDTIQAWEKGTSVNSEAIRLLRTAGLNQCSKQTLLLPPDSDYPVPFTPLSVGGLENIFDIPEGDRVVANDFNGQIATIIIDESQLDLSCPLKQRRVVSGRHSSVDLCNSNPCDPVYSTCYSYVHQDSDVCHCHSGFSPDSCNDKQDYSPFSLANGTHVEFHLGYDYFFNKGRSLVTNTSALYQTVSLSFTSAIDSPTGVLLYSKTDTSVSQLKVDLQTIRYTVYGDRNDIQLEAVSEEVTISAGVEYTIVIKMLSDNEKIKIEFGERNGQQLKELSPTVQPNGAISSSYPFVKQPSTTVSVRGSSDKKLNGDFSGCITELLIDGLPIPLNNFIRTGHQNTSVIGNTADLSLTCHSCYNVSSCYPDSICNIIGSLNEGVYSCTCRTGFCTTQPTTIIPTTSMNVPSISIRPTETNDGGRIVGVEDPNSSEKIPLNAIIGISVGSLFTVVMVVILLTLTIRCAYIRGKKKHSFQFVTQVTYHQKSDPHSTEQDIDKDAVVVPRSNGRGMNNYVDTIPSTIKHTHSLTDDSGIDGVVHSPLSLRESTSQETGFHTASEFDPHSRQSSPRRAYESGKSSSEQYDSDLETDSESLNTSGIEECQSPHEMKLLHVAAGNGNLMMPPGAPPIMLPGAPPMMHLRKLNSGSGGLLLREPDETGSEVSTTTNTTNRHYDDSESNISNGSKWYKSSSPSTIVSTDGPISHGHTHYHSHTLDSYKRSKRRYPPGVFKPHKSNSPPHYYINHNGSHASTPLSASPLVQKAHRFEYPPYSPSSNTRGTAHYENIDPIPGGPIPRLPVINEAGQYHQPPTHYHNRQHSDSSYMDMSPHMHQQMAPSHPQMAPPHPQMVPPHAQMVPPHPQMVPPHPQMIPPHPPPPEMMPPYYPGYQGTNLTPGGGAGSTKYCDLNSFAQVNPITYWEQQQRLRPTVDDGLNFLMEPYTKFEDVSTTPSVVESTLIDGDDESVFNGRNSEYGYMPSTGRRPITSRGLHDHPNPVPPVHMNTPPSNVPMMLSKIPRSRRNSERDSVKDEVVISDNEELTEATNTQDDGTNYPITHFPSADCCTPTFISDNHHRDDHILDSTSTLAAPDNDD